MGAPAVMGAAMGAMVGAIIIGIEDDPLTASQTQQSHWRGSSVSNMRDSVEQSSMYDTR